MLPLITPATLALLAGAIYVLLAATVWLLLRRRSRSAPMDLWSLGSLGFGIGFVLVASRPMLPIWIGHVLANGLLLVSELCCIASLRMSLGLPARPRLMLLVGAACMGLHLVLYGLGMAVQRVAFSSLVLAIGLGVIGHYARVTARQLQSRSGLLLAGLQALMSGLLVLRALSVALGWVPPESVDQSPLVWALVPVVLLSALYGNLGYLGLELDRLGMAELHAHRARLVEAARREVAERSANDLRQALSQRDELAAERDHLLQMLAHEIRQPLHNASGALQAAAMLVQSPQQPADAGQLSARLARAQNVLGDVRSVLDNTLAATLMLTRRDPLLVQDVDLHLLAHLVLGDLPEAQRVRTQVEWCTPLRSAELEPGLVRLALRNLLRNAFEHGGPDVDVVLRIEEQDTPAAMVLVVADTGSGQPGPQLDDGRASVSAGPGTQRRGLGLVIVRQVMALHHGQLVLAPNAPRGLQARLVFPDPSDMGAELASPAGSGQAETAAA